jgi:hypothetical protein
MCYSQATVPALSATASFDALAIRPLSPHFLEPLYWVLIFYPSKYLTYLKPP